MGNIPRRPTPIKPTAIHAYFDKIQFWVLNRLDHETIASLREQCGRGGLYVDNRRKRFDGRFRQRIELRQPFDNAIAWLAQRDDALVNRVEIAIDYVFKSWADRDDAWEFLHRHLVRRWHGKRQEIRLITSNPDSGDDVFGGTRYDAGRWAPNGTVFYLEKHSRITGEVACLHLEWRLNRLKAVRAAGIESGRDLLEFNHREFWQKRLLLYYVDRERLGRLIRNRSKGKRNRVSKVDQAGRYRIYIDGRTGETHVRAHYTAQELIDKLRPLIRINRALVPIPNELLLPE